jgi:hypothetical protein
VGKLQQLKQRNDKGKLQVFCCVTSQLPVCSLCGAAVPEKKMVSPQQQAQVVIIQLIIRNIVYGRQALSDVMDQSLT